MPPPTATPAPAPPADLTFAQAWSLWLAYRSAGTHPLRASTRADYDSIYRRHLSPAFAETPLSNFNGLAIANFTIALSATGISAKRVSNVLIPLRACLRWHHRIGTFPADPGPWFDASAPAADERLILTPAQIEALLAELPAFYRPMITFAAYVGVRAGELRALTWRDVDLVAHTATIDKTLFRDRPQRSTKTGHDRVVPLPPHVADALRGWRAECPSCDRNLVFPQPNGKPLDLDIFRARVFKPAVLRAGLPPRLRFHDLRHTSASLYLQSGATVREVMDIHGWRQMQTAMRYLHTPDTLATAAERLSALRESPADSSAGRETPGG